MPNLLDFWLLVLICMGESFIKFTYSHSLLLPFFILTWWCGILGMLWLDSVPTKHLYQDMQKYVVIFVTKIYQSKPIENIIPNSICIVFWRNMCMFSIREEIIQNPPFQSSGLLLVLLSVSSQVLLIGT